MAAAGEAAVLAADDGGPSLCAFERVRVIALRAAQLMQGSTPRLPASHRATVTARHEVDAGLVRAVADEADVPARAQRR